MEIHCWAWSREKPVLTPRWSCFVDLLSIAFVITIIPSGLSQKALPSARLWVPLLSSQADNPTLPTVLGRWVTQLCLFCHLTDLPRSSVHGILQPGILEWAAMPSSRGSSRPRDWTWVSYVSCIGRQVLCYSGHLSNRLTKNFYLLEFWVSKHLLYIKWLCV